MMCTPSIRPERAQLHQRGPMPRHGGLIFVVSVDLSSRFLIQCPVSRPTSGQREPSNLLVFAMSDWYSQSITFTTIDLCSPASLQTKRTACLAFRLSAKRETDPRDASVAIANAG